MKNYNIVFFDDEIWDELLPLTFTRPLAEIRIGILTIREKWLKVIDTDKYSYYTKNYLSSKYPINICKSNLFIHGALLPDSHLIDKIKNMKIGDVFSINNRVVLALLDDSEANNYINKGVFPESNNFPSTSFLLTSPCDIFTYNGKQIDFDFDLITKNRLSQPISKTNTIIGNGRIFAEEGAIAECAVFNTTGSSTIYLGNNSEVMEGSVIRGSFALCNNSQLKISTKIYGPTTIGPQSKVGGEINNSVIFGFSNKAHDGFLGNSVIGEWVNIGADSNNSNLKNDYSQVKIWNYPKGIFKNTGLQFAGLIMGDHSKCSINTMFNTGTVVGVSSNLFGHGFHRNFIPSFSWGGFIGYSQYNINKAIEVAKIVMNRRGIELTDIDADILKFLYENEYSNNSKL